MGVDTPDPDPAIVIESLDERQMKVMLLALLGDPECYDEVAALLPHIAQFAAANPDDKDVSVMNIVRLRKAVSNTRRVAEAFESSETKRKRHDDEFASFLSERYSARTLRRKLAAVLDSIARSRAHDAPAPGDSAVGASTAGHTTIGAPTTGDITTARPVTGNTAVTAPTAAAPTTDAAAAAATPATDGTASPARARVRKTCVRCQKDFFEDEAAGSCSFHSGSFRLICTRRTWVNGGFEYDEEKLWDCCRNDSPAADGYALEVAHNLT